MNCFTVRDGKLFPFITILEMETGLYLPLGFHGEDKPVEVQVPLRNFDPRKNLQIGSMPTYYRPPAGLKHTLKLESAALRINRRGWVALEPESSDGDQAVLVHLAQSRPGACTDRIRPGNNGAPLCRAVRLESVLSTTQRERKSEQTENHAQLLFLSPGEVVHFSEIQRACGLFGSADSRDYVINFRLEMKSTEPTLSRLGDNFDSED